MCNLYTTRKSAAEVAEWFHSRVAAPLNAPAEVVPGYPGMVVREEGGGRWRSTGNETDVPENLQELIAHTVRQSS
jgi:putative SOS response-associated peptidase YedK